jgi:flavin-dependent dehydrogenase
MGTSRYDVVIVGGRPAGASLAARLGQLGRSVLVVDKARFPSPPSVPSCPLLYPQAMALLSELGVDEAAYAHAVVPVRRAVLQFGPYFDAHLRVITSRGRDYLYGLDRTRFDQVLWTQLSRYPSVTAREGFTVTELLRDEGGAVVGVEGRAEDGGQHRIEAEWVVGADGRFSPIARKVGASIVEDRPEHQSTVFFADWEGLAPYGSEQEPIVHIYATGRGTDVLFFPKPEGHITVCTHQRADRVQTGGEPEAYYLRELERHPTVQRRLQGARRTGPVVGLKRVANRYLQAGGRGWLLVGDALHHKDPVDGQGIYDALLETKLLAESLSSIWSGERSAQDGVAWYGQRVREETYPMFQATLDRLKRELYDEPPEAVIRTLIRWMLNDEEYQEQFLRYLCREIEPTSWLTGGLMARTALRGAFRDLRRVLRG